MERSTARTVGFESLERRVKEERPTGVPQEDSSRAVQREVTVMVLDCDRVAVE